MKIEKKQLLFDTALLLMLFYDIVLRQSNYKMMYNVAILGNVIWAIVSLLLIWKIAITKYNMDDFWRILIIFVACVLSWQFSGEVSMLKFMFFTLSSKNIDLQRSLKIFSFASIIFCMLVVLSSFCGIIPNEIVGIRFGMNRYNLGFVAPSSLGYYSFSFSCYLVLCYRKKINYKFTLFNIAALGILWFIVNCKTAVISIVLLWMLFIISQRKGKVFYNKFWIITPYLLGGISLYFTVAFNSSNSFHKALNNFFSLRISYQNRYFKNTGIHLFGNSTALTSLKGIYLDNSYMSLLLRFGVIIFVIVLWLYSYSLSVAIREKNVNSVIVMLAALFYGLMEMTLYSYSMNIVLLVVMNYISKNQGRIEFSGKKNWI